MTRKEIIKSALKFLVLKQTEQGSQGFSDSDENEISWDKVIEWLEQQPCEDCTVIKKLSKKYYVEDAYGYTDEDIVNKVNEIIDVVNELSSVTPTRPTARWIDIGDEGLVFKCSLCGNKNTIESHFCPNCGARMEAET